ncbi:MAG: acyl-CoA dehydrogenase family protein [Pseudomonadales bacterium]|nr:acyl-CoA dehydrogenase family protein [Pseudomonadales bacterium]
MAALNEEQSILKDQAIAWINDNGPVAAFRAMRDSGNPLGFEQATWSAMADMGWPGILVPEEFGGSNLGYLTFGLILEELGKQLTASPLLASGLVGAAALILGGNAAQKKACLPRIADGSRIVTLAVDESTRHDPAGIALAAHKTANGFALSGDKCFVVEGGAATDFVVAARTAGNAGDANGITLFLVDGAADGISRTLLRTADSRGYAHLKFANLEVSHAAVLGDVDNGGALLDAILDRARAGVAAEMLGTASQAFAMTLEYLKTRKQFGQVIGAFQALGHRAAELYTEMELARSAVEGALAAIDADAADVPAMCSLSKCKAGAFLFRMSNQLIQIHGGIGMTDEFDAGFYLKRARALETMYGNQGFHRARFATLMGF